MVLRRHTVGTTTESSAFKSFKHVGLHSSLGCIKIVSRRKPRTRYTQQYGNQYSELVGVSGMLCEAWHICLEGVRR